MSRDVGISSSQTPQTKDPSIHVLAASFIEIRKESCQMQGFVRNHRSSAEQKSSCRLNVVQTIQTLRTDRGVSRELQENRNYVSVANLFALLNRQQKTQGWPSRYKQRKKCFKSSCLFLAPFFPFFYCLCKRTLLCGKKLR